MRAPSFVTSALEDAAELSATHAIVRLSAALAAFVAIGSMYGAGGTFGPFLIAVLAVVLVAVARPDTQVGTLLMALVAGGWALTTDRQLDGWSLAGALSLLVSHACLALAAATHPAAALPVLTLARWGLRCLVVGAATALVWLAIAGLQRTDAPSSAVVFVLALVAVAALVAAVWGTGFAERSDAGG